MPRMSTRWTGSTKLRWGFLGVRRLPLVGLPCPGNTEVLQAQGVRLVSFLVSRLDPSEGVRGEGELAGERTMRSVVKSAGMAHRQEQGQGQGQRQGQMKAQAEGGKCLACSRIPGLGLGLVCRL